MSDVANTKADGEQQAGILVVDDDAAVCWALEQALAGEGYQVLIAADAAIARRQLRRHHPDLVLSDVRMPGESGLDLLTWIRQEHAGVPVVVMTAHGTMETAVEAVRRGAFDYLAKPIDLDRLLEVVRRALGEDHLAAAARVGAEPVATSEIIGATPAMQEVYRRIAAGAAADVGVLITGPSGSGKELVARALHRHSRRSAGPFVAVNCGALPDHLVESELFGHEAGAFTDARERSIGRVQAAEGGTLFLDEVGELPAQTQVKLLRFLEDHRLTRVGGSEEIAVNVRVIAATNRDLESAVRGGVFRDDLAFRLQVLRIHLPALAERMDDLPALIRHFLGRIADRLGRDLAITDEAMRNLHAHSWPGNVRELRHVLEEAAVMATGGIIAPEHLRLPELTGAADVGNASASGLATAVRREMQRLLHRAPGEALRQLHDLVEAAALGEALARTKGNQLRAAELLGINRITLKKRMDELGIGKG